MYSDCYYACCNDPQAPDAAAAATAAGKDSKQGVATNKEEEGEQCSMPGGKQVRSRAVSMSAARSVYRGPKC
jgi:hypothetical protein